jgi:hypothetical protein
MKQLAAAVVAVAAAVVARNLTKNIKKAPQTFVCGAFLFS